MAERQADTKLPDSRQHLNQRSRAEVVAFVEIDMKAPLAWSRQRRCMKARQQDRPENFCFREAQSPLRQAYDHDLAIQDAGQVDGTARSPERRAHARIRHQHADLVQRRTRRLALLPLGQRREFAFPEASHHRISDVFKYGRTVRLICQHSPDAEERRLGRLEERCGGIVQDLIQDRCRYVVIAPNALECVDRKTR